MPKPIEDKVLDYIKRIYDSEAGKWQIGLKNDYFHVSDFLTAFTVFYESFVNPHPAPIQEPKKDRWADHIFQLEVDKLVEDDGKPSEENQNGK